MKLCEKNIPITDFNLPITILRQTKKLFYRKRGYRRYITTKRQDKYTKIGKRMPCTYKFYQCQTTNFEVSYVEHYPIRDMHLGSILVHSSQGWIITHQNVHLTILTTLLHHSHLLPITLSRVLVGTYEFQNKVLLYVKFLMT